MDSIAGLAALGLALGAAFSIVVATLRLGIGPSPTSRPVRRVVLGLVPADTTGLVYELGSGWGGLARALARHCPHATVVGIEASFVPWAFARLVQAVRPLPNLKYERGDFFARPLVGGSVYVCYLFTGGMQRLGSHLRLTSNTMLISATFALPGHAPTDTVRADDLFRSPVYRYRG